MLKEGRIRDGANKAGKDYLCEIAKKRGVKLRISPEGQVHFFGHVPGKEEKVWYFVGWDVDSAAKTLVLEEDD
ncbi:hypothetical protein FACS1894205_6880 [Alphaproteobacteria bacterium]|nr:hypothetical protein FACS1894205_6880 [Alphaproteobacteria bacterium]